MIDKTFMTRSHNVTPKTTEQNLIVLGGESEAAMTSDKRLCSGYRTVKAK